MCMLTHLRALSNKFECTYILTLPSLLLALNRGVALFNKLKVPVLGLIENMSYHQCVACGHKEHTFGEGGVQRMSQELGLDVLGEVRQKQYTHILTHTHTCTRTHVRTHIHTHNDVRYCN
jgi:hypothetical protein